MKPDDSSAPPAPEPASPAGTTTGEKALLDAAGELLRTAEAMRAEVLEARLARTRPVPNDLAALLPSAPAGSVSINASLDPTTAKSIQATETRVRKLPRRWHLFAMGVALIVEHLIEHFVLHGH